MYDAAINQTSKFPVDARDIKIQELEQRLSKLESLFTQLKEHTAPDLELLESAEDIRKQAQKQAYYDLGLRLTMERLESKKLKKLITPSRENTNAQ